MSARCMYVTVLRALPALALLMLLPPAAAFAAMPRTLDCSGRYHVNWRAESPIFVETAPPDSEELGGVTIHLASPTGRRFQAGLEPHWQAWGTKAVWLPSVRSDFIVFTFPIWLLAAICLAWPVTSLLLARRRRKGRGFEIEVRDQKSEVSQRANDAAESPSDL